jgi:hypothetical protein
MFMLTASDGRAHCGSILMQEWSKYFEIIEAVFWKETHIKGVNSVLVYTHL